MPEVQLRKRHIAYKLLIKDILNSEFIKSENFPNYLDFDGKEISRVNVIGVVVDKSDFDNYKNVIIDDGSGRISARMFESMSSFDKISIGDVVVLIGRPREFSSERYLLIEIMKKADDSWARVRNLELWDAHHEKSVSEEEKNYIFDDSYRNKIIKAIKERDKGEGVSIEDLPNQEHDEKIIDLLLKEGEVFEVKPGKLKVLE